jgi:hypothetical protein
MEQVTTLALDYPHFDLAALAIKARPWTAFAKRESNIIRINCFNLLKKSIPF